MSSLTEQEKDDVTKSWVNNAAQSLDYLFNNLKD